MFLDTREVEISNSSAGPVAMVRPVRLWPYRFLREKKWRRLNSNPRVRILPQHLSQLQDVQSMTRPSLHFLEALSIRSCNERTGGFSHHSDARPAREMWAGLTCAKFNVACLRMMATFTKRGQIKPFSQPTSHFSVESLEKLLM